jgi:hypothetical protein
MLEQKLDEIDDLEKCPLFLGKSRIDRNPDRIAVLSEIETSLEDYGMPRVGLAQRTIVDKHQTSLLKEPTRVSVMTRLRDEKRRVFGTGWAITAVSQGKKRNISHIVTNCLPSP